MSKNIDLTNMPDTFCMCNVNGCPQAERCLRQTVYDGFEGENLLQKDNIKKGSTP